MGGFLIFMISENEQLKQIQEAKANLKISYDNYWRRRREVGNPHMSQEIYTLREKLAQAEEGYRQTLGIDGIIVPSHFNSFSNERNKIRDLQDRFGMEITTVGRIGTLALNGEDPIRAAEILEERGIHYAILVSGPGGSYIIEGSKGQKHSNIREALWGVEPEIGLRRPDVSGFIFNIDGRKFFVTDDPTGDMLWPSLHFTLDSGYQMGAEVLNVNSNLNGARNIFNKTRRQIGIKRLDDKSAVILLGESLKPLILNTFNMQAKINQIEARIKGHQFN